MIEVPRARLSNLRGECGEDPEVILGKMEVLSRSGLGGELMWQQTNFELLAPVPTAELVVHSVPTS